MRPADENILSVPLLCLGIHDVQSVWTQVGEVRGQNQRLQHVQPDAALHQVINSFSHLNSVLGIRASLTSDGNPGSNPNFETDPNPTSFFTEMLQLNF